MWKSTVTCRSESAVWTSGSASRIFQTPSGHIMKHHEECLQEVVGETLDESPLCICLGYLCEVWGIFGAHFCKAWGDVLGKRLGSLFVRFRWISGRF